MESRSLALYMDVFISFCCTQSKSTLVLSANTWSGFEFEPAFRCLVSEPLGSLQTAQASIQSAQAHFNLLKLTSIYSSFASIRSDSLVFAGKSVSLLLKSGEQGGSAR